MLENLEKEMKAAQTKGSLSSGLKNIQTAFVQEKTSCKNQGECWVFNLCAQMEGNSERVLHEFTGYKLCKFFILGLGS